MKKKLNKTNIYSVLIFILFLALILFSYILSSSLELESDLVYGNSLSVFGFDFSIKESSLFIAATIIGLVDGFNPCAMWVLIYLITLVSTLENKRKMFIIVGTFVATEAIMYFLILAGWLNLFQFIGFSRWILYIVGIFALWFGYESLDDFIKSGGKMVCEVGDVKSRKKTMIKIQEIVESPITIISLFAVIILAITINAIEFVCSAGLPAIFTQMLAISDVSVFAKYFYIFVYDFFFMLDDFIIFGLAFYAINSDVFEKYSGISKLLGGIIMIIIGIILLFFPNLLF